MKITRKEFNKLVERTSKADAYRATYQWGASFKEESKAHGSTLWYADTKASGHKEFLQSLPYYYDYAESVARVKEDDSLVIVED